MVTSAENLSFCTLPFLNWVVRLAIPSASGSRSLQQGVRDALSSLFLFLPLESAPAWLAGATTQRAKLTERTVTHQFPRRSFLSLLIMVSPPGYKVDKTI